MTIENQILASLSTDVLDRLTPHFKHVTLAHSQLIYSFSQPLSHLYFPIDCLLSITVIMQNGATVQAGMVSNQGMLGINTLMSNSETPQTQYIVQHPGRAIRIEARMMRQEFDRNGELRDVLLRYTHVLAEQIAQTAACNALHLLDRRLASWLLQAQAQVGSDHLSLTHEFIATMLGVRRAGVTQSASKLQAQKLIQYHRGHVTILNRCGLEDFACECFKRFKRSPFQSDRSVSSI